MTKKSWFSLFNAVIMVLLAVPNLRLVMNFNLRESSDVSIKLFLVLFYAYPAFSLYILRFFKVYSMAYNEGQVVCNQNYFTGKNPLGSKLLF